MRNYAGKVFFIRYLSTYPEIIGEFGWNNKKAQELKNALDHFFPSLDFTLVIPSCSHSDISEVGIIDNVIEFKMKDLTNYDEYGPLFNALLKK